VLNRSLACSFVVGAICIAPTRCEVQAQQPATPADVMQQVYAEAQRIKSLEAQFQAKEERFLPKTAEREWTARYYYQWPDAYRIDYWFSSSSDDVTSEGTPGGDKPKRILEFAPTKPPNSRIVARHAGGTYSGPSASRFFLNLPIEMWRTKKLDVSAWTIRSERKDDIRISGAGLDAGTTIELHIDPTKNFAVTAIIENVGAESDARRQVVETAIEYYEPAKGFWAPGFGRSTQWSKRIGGEKVLEYNYEVDPNSVRINHGIDPGLLALEFPQGTRVSDALTKQTYYVGGTSRNKGDLDELLVKAAAISNEDTVRVTAQPGALRAIEPRNYVLYGFVVFAAVVAVVVLSIIRWRQIRSK